MLLMCMWLLADAKAIGLQDLGPAIASIGSIGISSWHVYYTTTVTIPKLLQSHADERKEMQGRHDATVVQLVAEMKRQRRAFAKQSQAYLQMCQQFSQWMDSHKA